MIPSNSRACLRDLVGIRYGFRGEGGGLDCWQLLHRAARDLFGRELPTFADLERLDQVGARMRKERDQWLCVTTPAPCDVAMFRLFDLKIGELLHVGLVLDPPTFLHTLKGRESCIERYTSHFWRERVLGFYRWPS